MLLPSSGQKCASHRCSPGSGLFTDKNAFVGRISRNLKRLSDNTGHKTEIEYLKSNEPLQCQLNCRLHVHHERAHRLCFSFAAWRGVHPPAPRMCVCMPVLLSVVEQITQRLGSQMTNQWYTD